MIKIHLIEQNDRELYFRTAADILKIPYEVVEKDYWVVWALEGLFSINDLRPHLTFEGGTSLSKIYGIINRFSEDIDLSKKALKERIDEPKIDVQVLNAERTFWEKATILHQYAHLPDEKKLPPRLSRHFYDFFCLLNSTIKKTALAESQLLNQVAKHKETYFYSKWANYNSAKKGSLKLSPPPKISKMLEKDYALMRPMLFRDIPDWNLIMQTIKTFETEFNEL